MDETFKKLFLTQQKNVQSLKMLTHCINSILFECLTMTRDKLSQNNWLAKMVYLILQTSKNWLKKTYQNVNRLNGDKSAVDVYSKLIIQTNF